MNIKKEIIKFIKNYPKSAIGIAGILLVLLVLFLLVLLTMFIQSPTENNIISQGNYISNNRGAVSDSISMSKNYKAPSRVLSAPSVSQYKDAQNVSYDKNPERKVIKSANLSVVVDDIEES